VVWDALRNFAQPDALRGNPLLRSRLVTDRVGAGGSEADRITALRALLQEAAEALQPSPRRVKWYRALYHTYLHPASTQEKAAELLGVPISSFRRHLHDGIACVADILWHGNHPDTNRFAMAREGMIPPEEFFNPENLQRIIMQAQTAAGTSRTSARSSVISELREGYPEVNV
jgi:hypothetical protein